MLQPDHVAFADLSTPCLVVDGPALQRNIDKMAGLARFAGVKLRPHAKTHMDHPHQVEALASALQPGDPQFGVLVDVDVGQARTGVVDIADGLRLAQLIAQQPKLKFMGIQGFAGNAQHIPDFVERREAAQKAANKLSVLREVLSLEGLSPAIITGSGTGTQNFDAQGPYTELQVGSYVFMDADYDRIRDERDEPPPFEPSLFVLATVVSVNRAEEVTVDAGTKALATNGPAPVVLLGAPAASRYRFGGDEHGILSIPSRQPPPRLGARVLIGATHCDPTVNLHGCYYEFGDEAVRKWPILGRYGAYEVAL